MKKIAEKKHYFSVLASLAIVVFASASMAADFFPLDVWEEMEIWGENKATSNSTVVEAYSATQKAALSKTAMTNKMFPFDVQSELNELGGVEYLSLKNRKAHYIYYGTTREEKTNPYWMPEELRAP